MPNWGNGGWSLHKANPRKAISTPPYELSRRSTFLSHMWKGNHRQQECVRCNMQNVSKIRPTGQIGSIQNHLITRGKEYHNIFQSIVNYLLCNSQQWQPNCALACIWVKSISFWANANFLCLLIVMLFALQNGFIIIHPQLILSNTGAAFCCLCEYPSLQIGTILILQGCHPKLRLLCILVMLT